MGPPTDTEGMDDGSSWLRVRIARSLLRRSAVTWLVAALSSYAVLLWRTSEPGWALAGWAVVLGQLVVVVRLGVAVTANPLSYGFLRRYLARPYHLVPASVPGPWHDVGEEIEGFGLAWAMTVHDPGTDPTPVFDVFLADDGRLLAAVSRATGDLTMLTRLNDGRVLHTSSMLVPPHPELVINTAPEADALVIWGLHVGALGGLAAHGVKATQTPGPVFRDAVVLEHDAYRRLGPWLGCFYDPGRSRVAPMTVPVSSEELLATSLAA